MLFPSQADGAADGAADLFKAEVEVMEEEDAAEALARREAELEEVGVWVVGFL